MRQGESAKGLIGSFAGATSQAANSIVISASGLIRNNTVADSTVIFPIRGVAATTPVMTYDTTTGEVRYNSSSARYKREIRDISQELDTSCVFDLTPRSFTSKLDEKRYIGFISEEAVKSSEYFVWRNSEGILEGNQLLGK